MKFNPEILGLVATTIVLISFATSGEQRIRRINLVGAVLFIFYGLLIKSPSVWILNGALFVVHAYKLTRLNLKGKI